MNYLYLEYPKCSTCKSAKEWMLAHQVSFEARDITEQNPTKEELKLWHQKSKLPLLRFFNTSGQIYREQNLRDKVKILTQEEMYDLLATDGMMIKRPLLILEDMVLVGFKEEEWNNALLTKPIKRF